MMTFEECKNTRSKIPVIEKYIPTEEEIEQEKINCLKREKLDKKIGFSLLTLGLTGISFLSGVFYEYYRLVCK